MGEQRMRKSQKKEILWNITNSGLAGVLVLLGALTSGGISASGFCAALVAALIVAFSQFKDYWMKEQPEYSTKLLGFIK